MLQKNTIVTVQISSISGDGSGIAKIDGEVVFIPFTAIGDIVKIIIIKSTKNYAVGKLLEIISPSSSRKTPDCEFFGKCGGCVFRHLSIKEEERIKTETVVSAMKRIGHLDVNVEECITPNAITYRNKAQLPVTQTDDGIYCGYYANHSHRIVAGSSKCIANPSIFSEISNFIIAFMEDKKISGYSESTGTGIVRHLYLRINKNGKILLCLVLNSKELISKEIESEFVSKIRNVFKDIISIYVNFNPEVTNVILGDSYRLIWGEEFFEDELLNTKLIMSPDSFFQVNRKGAEVIYSKAFSLLNGFYENIYDLYCGIGSIGITLFNQIKEAKIDASAKRLFGIEIVEKAIVCARENAKNNGIENAKFISCDSTEITKMDWFDNFPPSLVILDPPRKGATIELLDFLIQKKVSNILYISCDPATLARDMSRLFNGGYNPSSVYPINLFPGTKHIECCVLLTKNS